eukprot:569435-Pyramimonas_sp.AAC.1
MKGPWRTVSAAHWRQRESMPMLEARSVLWALKHQLRRLHNHGRRLLFIVDAMSVALMMSKGRSSVKGMNRVRRQRGANCLASGVSASVRWVTSEDNPADEPSRLFQPPRPELHQAFIGVRPAAPTRGDAVAEPRG